MASITVTPQTDYEPPRNIISVHASPGNIFDSIEVTRLQDGVETLIRRQPVTGLSDVTVYDYEPAYDVPAQYRVRGVERNASLASSWTGAVDASASTLSKDGKLVATNRFPNPRGVSTGKTPDELLNGTVSWRWGGGNGFGLVVNPTSTLGPYALFKMTGLTPGETMVCQVEVGAINVQNPRGILVNACDSKSQKIGGIPSGVPSQRVNMFTFVVPDDGDARLQFRGGLTGDVAFYDIICVRQTEWQAMQSLGVNYFDGNSYQTGTTANLDLTSSTATLSPDTGWLIHPGNPAKSMRLPMGRITGIGDVAQRANAVRHDILGGHYPVYTITGPRYSPEFNLQLRTKTMDDEDMLQSLVDDQYPILFNPRAGDAQRLNLRPMYLQVGDVSDARYTQMIYDATRYAGTPGEWRDWTLPCTQVDSPAISQQAVGWTYAQLMVENNSYQQARTRFTSYANLQADNRKG